jgi:hypothetical protein
MLDDGTGHGPAVDLVSRRRSRTLVHATTLPVPPGARRRPS